MSYQTLLLLLDHTRLCYARTRTAIGLAQAFDAHLVGLAPTGALEVPALPEAMASISDFAGLAWETLRAQADEAARTFDKAAAASPGLASARSVVVEADTRAALLRHAQCCDLTVLSQPDPDQPGHLAQRQLVEHFVVDSPRPTLVLPYAGALSRIGETVMVAWDDSREAARAVADALPFLRKARHVHVVNWGEGGRVEAGTPLLRLQEVCEWMRGHGVEAQPHVEVTEVPIADAMLSRVNDLEVDLLVMGAYGHARWTERVLGGATRGVLATMTVPVLMSH